MKQRTRIFLTVLVSSFIVPFLASSINVAIPAIAAEFQVAATELSWVVTAFLLGSSSMVLPFARLADIHGRMRWFRRGIFAVSLTALAATFAQSAETLVVFRFLQGISIAMIFGTSMAILVASHDPKERGKVIGCSTAAVYIGLSAGPFLGGLIVESLNWRALFFLTSLLMLICLMIAHDISSEWYGERENGLDTLGCLLYPPAVIATLLGLSAFESHNLAPLILFLGLILTTIFLIEQKKASAPLMELKLFNNVVFAMSSLAALLHYSATFAISFLLSLYLQLVRGMDEITAGAFLLLQPVVMAILSPLTGTLSDKIQPRILASLGMLLTALGLLILSQLTASTPLFCVGATLVIIGIGFALFSSPNSNAIMGSVAKKHLGVASSLMSIVRIFGQAVSMATVTLLLNRKVLPHTNDLYLESLLHCVQDIFTCFMIICLLGAVISMLRGKTSDSTSPR